MAMSFYLCRPNIQLLQIPYTWIDKSKKSTHVRIQDWDFIQPPPKKPTFNARRINQGPSKV